MCFQKLRCFFYLKKTIKVWTKTAFMKKIFKQTLYGIDFSMTLWMNLMAAGAQVIVKQLDCISQKISLPGKAQVIDSVWVGLHVA